MRAYGLSPAPANDGYVKLRGRVAGPRWPSVGKIVTAVQAHAQVSELVGSWHSRYHEQAERVPMTQATLHLERCALPGVPHESLRPLARLWVYALDGIITHGVRHAERRQLCHEMVTQLERMSREGPTTRAIGDGALG